MAVQKKSILGTVAAIIAGVALLGTAGFGSVLGSDSIGEDLTAKVKAELAAKQLTGEFEVSFSGREGTIQSLCATEATSQQAVSAAEKVYGVRWITDATVAPTKQPEVRISSKSSAENSETSYELSGRVCSEQLKEDYGQLTNKSLQSSTVDNQLNTDSEVAVADWAPNLLAAVEGLPEIKNLDLHADGTALTINGEVKNQAEIDQIIAKLSTAVGFTINNNLVALESEAQLTPQQLKNLVNKTVIYFKADSFELNRETKAQLRKLAQALKEHPETKLNVIGHVAESGVGSSDKISKSRANRVVSYLVEHGVAKSQLKATSRGGLDPAVNGNFQSENRRVNFEIEGDN